MTDHSHEHVTGIALRSIAIAHEFRHEMVTLEHLLATLLERSEVQKCLKDLTIDYLPLQQDIDGFLRSEVHTRVTAVPVRTREFDIVLGRTIAYARSSSRHAPNGLDVFVQLAQMPHEDSHAVTLLLHAGIDALRLKRYIAHGAPRHARDGEPPSDVEPADRASAVNCIKKYCIDLNELAITGKIDPLIGRMTEITRIAQIVARRTRTTWRWSGRRASARRLASRVWPIVSSMKWCRRYCGARWYGRSMSAR